MGKGSNKKNATSVAIFFFLIFGSPDVLPKKIVEVNFEKKANTYFIREGWDSIESCGNVCLCFIGLHVPSIIPKQNASPRSYSATNQTRAPLLAQIGPTVRATYYASYRSGGLKGYPDNEAQAQHQRSALKP